MIRMPEEKQIPLEDIRLGPIRKKLPPELEPMVRWTYRHLGHFGHSTYEQWVLGFVQDLHPEKVLGLCVSMTWGVLEFLKRHPDADKTTLVTAVISRSLGCEPNELCKCEVDELEALARSVPPELLDPENQIFKT
jgi:hypothetical protein